MQESILDLALRLYGLVTPFYGVGLLCVIVLIPLSALKSTRGFAGSAFYLLSFLFGLVTWLWCAVVTLVSFNWIVLLIGVLLFGVGVVPLSLLGSVFAGEWAVFGGIVLALLVVVVSRFGGLWVKEKARD